MAQKVVSIPHPGTVRVKTLDSKLVSLTDETFLKEARYRLNWYANFTRQKNNLPPCPGVGGRVIIFFDPNRDDIGVEEKKDDSLIEGIALSESVSAMPEFLSLPMVDTPLNYNNMNPTTPSERLPIYSDSFKKRSGARNYLNKRAAIHPNQKYKYPNQSSHEYGWQIPKPDDFACDLANVKFVDKYPPSFSKFLLTRDPIVPGARKVSEYQYQFNEIKTLDD